MSSEIWGQPSPSKHEYSARFAPRHAYCSQAAKYIVPAVRSCFLLTVEKFYFKVSTVKAFETKETGETR